MSIFRRNDTVSSPASPSGAADASASASVQRRRVTHIAAGTRVQGQITGPTELLVDGEVEGEIRVESAVSIGNDGVVTGPISAQVVRVGGRVTGNIHAGERAEVAPSGSVEGDIAAPRVVIAEGAFFKGRVEMRGDRERPSRAAPSPVPSPARPPHTHPERERGAPTQAKTKGNGANGQNGSPS